jgi:hypothetical protein
VQDVGDVVECEAEEVGESRFAGAGWPCEADEYNGHRQSTVLI